MPPDVIHALLQFQAALHANDTISVRIDMNY